MPIAMRRSPITTAEQLLRLDDAPWRHELVRGELLTMSPAGSWHGEVALLLGERLAPFVRRRGLGVCFATDTGFQLAHDPDTVLAPDVAFVRRERMPKRRGPGYFPGPPDLAVEVMSPNDRMPAVLKKAKSWLEHGARSVWIMNPKRRTVAVHGADGTSTTFHVGDTVVDEVVPGFRVRVAELFPPGR